MVPVRTGVIGHLPERLPVGTGRHHLMRTAVHYCRQVHAVPVDGGAVVELVVHIHVHGIALVHKQRRPPETAVDAAGNGLLPRAHDLLERITDGEAEAGAGQRVRYPEVIVGLGMGRGGAEQQGAEEQVLHAGKNNHGTRIIIIQQII